MTKEWIEEKIKEAHQNAVDHGFYECPECNGAGGIQIGDPLSEFANEGYGCQNCSGTGIDPNKNIGELLMLIVSELGEVLEAHRKGKFSAWESLDRLDWGNPDYPMLDVHKSIFNSDIKNTREDKIADVFIQLFDLCGYYGWPLSLPDGPLVSDRNYSNMANSLYLITKDVVSDNFNIFNLFYSLICFCNYYGIPIQKHIEAKIYYNKTRPHKHGKEY